MAEINLSSLLELALSTAKKAGQNILKNISKNQEVLIDLPRDVKIDADHMLESYIIEQLSQEFNFPILSEEAGFLLEKDSNIEYRWVVDPLDGSVNFSRGIPACCISIGFWRKEEPLLGVIYDFFRDEAFTGLVGKGAWLNRKPIQVSKVAQKSQAILCTGFPVGGDFSKKSVLNFVEEVRKFKKVRLLGSAALSLAYVAAGRADAYHEDDIKIWDVAAGLALVKAAGGIYRFSWSSKPNALKVIASNAHLWGDIYRK